MSQRTAWKARHFWHFLVWLLIWTALWDSVGLLTGGDSVLAGPSYDVIRLIGRYIGSMRALGIPLGVICMVLMVVTTWSYGRHSAGRRPNKVFPVCLSLLAGWYSCWTVGILTANVIELMDHGVLLSWPAFSKLGFITAVAFRMAMLPPPPPAPYGQDSDPAVDGGNGSDLSG